VRSALYQLHVWVVFEHMPLTPHRPVIVSYLSEAYVWYGDVLEDVEALVEDVRLGASLRNPVLADDSGAYIDEFLEPLFRQVCESGGGHTSERHPMTSAFLPIAQRLYAAIVSLN
jgi:hypothetical protein